MQLCILTGMPFEEAFENAHYFKFKQNATNVTLPPMGLKYLKNANEIIKPTSPSSNTQIEETFKNATLAMFFNDVVFKNGRN